MAKQGGSLGRGRRTLEEVPPVPDAEGLSDLERRAQARLRELVDRAGGRHGTRGGSPIPISDIELLADYLNSWACDRSVDGSSGRYYNGRPGIWHALDELYPLQDPNRWDALRLAITSELERRGWRRRTPPRGTTWDLPN